MSRDDWPVFRPRVTVVDVLESGACFSGVRKWVEEHGGQIAGLVHEHASNTHIVKATRGYGSGGDGSGSGSGYGYGSSVVVMDDDLEPA